jgi:alpha,alpha-trehalose phosphorylase
VSGGRFTVEPWLLRETRLDCARPAHAESLFSLSNGHIGLRGNLDEGEPHGLPGTYLNGVYERRPLPYAEAGYGYPESGQTIINVTNGKILRLLVDDEPFDIRYGQLRSHERVLDFRTGVLERTVEWTSPAGQGVRVRTRRIVSFTQRAVVAICLDVEPVGDPARIVVQSELVANEEQPEPVADPRVTAALRHPLEQQWAAARGLGAELVHRTARSGILVAAAMDHLVDAPGDVATSAETDGDWARVSVTTVLEPGRRLRLVKFVAYGWSQQRSLPAVRDQVAAALTAARHTGWDGLLDEQRAYLDDFWARADVQVDGDAELQQAVRFALFAVLQAGARAERRSIPAKGLTGSGYEGHCFWDTEMFVLPVLTHTLPSAAADVLRWRHGTLPLAADRARQLGFAGTAFPWRTINGEECSGYWPAGTAAFHVNAGIADAVLRYVHATGDEAFEREIGLELLVGTARLWRSLGHHDLDGAFRIDGVTGPDEYSALADNNLYTNVMARRNLRGAAEAVARHPHEASRLGVDAEEAATWRDASAAMVVPYDEKLGVHPQSEGFTRHQVWDFAGTPPEKYPLLLHYPYFDLYRKQVVKQADLVLALQMCGDMCSLEQKRRDYEYYERITVRDSSLSACTQAVVGAEVGHVGLAYDYTAEVALLDLHDLNGNTGDGLHLAGLAGTWIALVVGFGGMRDHDALVFRPRLPEGIDRLSFGIVRGTARLRVTIVPRQATYELVAGDALTLRHYDEDIDLTGGTAPATRSIPPVPRLPRPSQPAGRAPARRFTENRR